jgi:hypothetical protein
MSGIGSKVTLLLLAICVSLAIATHYGIESKTDCGTSECLSYLAYRQKLVDKEESLYYDANESMNDLEKTGNY